MKTLVIAEHDNASLKPATLNTVTAALQCGGDVHVLVAGHNADPAAAAAAQISGVTKVLHIDAESLAHGIAENLTAQIVALATGYSHLLFPATASGKNVAPRVAAKLDVGQLSDVTKVLSADTFERPIYAGNAIATVQSLDAIKVLTVRTTGFDAAALGGSAAMESLAAQNNLKITESIIGFNKDKSKISDPALSQLIKVGGYYELQIKFSLEGSYTNFMSYINQVHSLRRVTSISTIKPTASLACEDSPDGTYGADAGTMFNGLK